MRMICVSNKSKKEDLVIGNVYNVLEHENPKILWVYVPDKNPYFENSEFKFITIQCYKSDFVPDVSIARDKKLNQLFDVNNNE